MISVKDFFPYIEKYAWNNTPAYLFQLETSTIVPWHEIQKKLHIPYDESLLKQNGYIPLPQVNIEKIERAFVKQIQNRKIQEAFENISDMNYDSSFKTYFESDADIHLGYKSFGFLMESYEKFLASIKMEEMLKWCKNNQIYDFKQVKFPK